MKKIVIDTLGADKGERELVLGAISAHRQNTNYQLVLDVTCGISIYGTVYKYLANISDLPRGGVGSIQDAFNIYGIDRVNKTVRIARVGSNITSEAKDRKCMIIPYKD